MIRFATALLGSLLLVPIVLAQAEQPVPPLIDKVMKASMSLRYRGERRIQLRFGPDLVQHTEYILKDGPRTRLWFPDEGSFRGQIIIENEGERRHYFPDRNVIEVLPPRREEHAGRFSKFGKGRGTPTFKIDDGGVIAGFTTKQVEISGPTGTVFLRMWVDPRSGLVLKRVMYNKKGEQQAIAEFVRVDLNPTIKRSDFELDIRNAKIISPREKLSELITRGGFANVAIPPKGPFQLESSRIQRIENVPALVQVYVSKNGRLTFFQIKTAVNPEELKRFGRGEKVNSYSWQKAGASFVLLGDLSEADLRKIAANLGV